ncbi:hypothetical protein [Azospirillum endophyticum]
MFVEQHSVGYVADVVGTMSIRTRLDPSFGEALRAANGNVL